MIPIIIWKYDDISKLCYIGKTQTKSHQNDIAKCLRYWPGNSRRGKKGDY